MEPWLRQLGLCFPESLVIRHPVNRGKGAAVRTGVRCSLGERVLICDADGATDLQELCTLDAELSRGGDLACGSRCQGTASRTAFRRALAALFSVAVWRLTRLSVADTQCGFKLFRGDLARELFAQVREEGYLYDVEVLMLAEQRGLRIREIGIKWLEIPGSKVRPLRDGLRMLWGLLGLRRRISRSDGPLAVRKAA